jgi:thiamine-phosphate pyrophosphorylase
MVPAFDLEQRIIDLMKAGVRLVQLRLKVTPLAECIFVGRRVRALTRASDALLIVNDSAHLAQEIDADGVHLGAGDAAVEKAHEILKGEMVIGVSCYADRDRVERYGPDRISYIGLSSPWESPLKPDKPMPSPKEFKRLVKRAKVPVYAIGGVTPELTKAALKAGCHGVAAVTSLFADPEAAENVPRFFEAIGDRP